MQVTKISQLATSHSTKKSQLYRLSNGREYKKQLTAIPEEFITIPTRLRNYW